MGLNMTPRTLAEIVNIFKCCIFTWGALTTILPAFIIAGAIIAFVPSVALTKYLGAGAKRYISYPAAALVGMALPACSCNIVPLFASILGRGAGIGPAFTFLYAGPAINLISTIMTFQVIGWLVGLLRVAGVFVISITLGLIMERLFSAKEKIPAAEPALEVEKVKKGRLCLLFALLFSIIIIGASLTSNRTGSADETFLLKVKSFAFGALLLGLIALVTTRFKKAEILDWAMQTGKLIKAIVPLFIVSILVVGLIAKFIDIHWIQDMLAAKKNALGYRMLGPNLKSITFGTLLGELMYFPILSEIVFTKAFLKLGMDIGPAIAILLSGPGTSLPGFILIGRFVGWKKVAAYFAISVILEILFATILSMSIGDYICACLVLK